MFYRGNKTLEIINASGCYVIENEVLFYPTNKWIYPENGMLFCHGKEWLTCHNWDQQEKTEIEATCSDPTDRRSGTRSQQAGRLPRGREELGGQWLWGRISSWGDREALMTAQHDQTCCTSAIKALFIHPGPVLRVQVRQTQDQGPRLTE